jgi:hypothetical protein
MRKKYYTAPFRGMLIIGSFYTALFFLTSYVIEFVKRRDFINASLIITSILWMTLYFGEAVVYWRLRKMNIDRRESKIHVWLMAIAVVLPLAKGMLVALLDRLPGGLSMETAITIDYVQLGVFWVLQVVGHTFFLRVIVKHFKKSVGAIKEASETMNLLDDIGID